MKLIFSFRSFNIGISMQKPVGVLALGIVAMLLSCLILLSLILCTCREVYSVQEMQCSQANDGVYELPLEETLVLAVILIFVICMTSSSMVEEEHYIWHYMTSTLYLVLLRKMAQLLTADCSLLRGQNKKCKFQMLSVVMLLVCGRILRGWHQGGVNWAYLPDISKWLEQAGSNHVKAFQLISGVLVISSGLCALSLLKSRKIIVQVVRFSFIASGLLVMLHIIKYQDSTFGSSNYGATLLAQIIYVALGSVTVGTVISLPWLMPIWTSEMDSSPSIYSSTLFPSDVQNSYPIVQVRDALYGIGWTYILCWCLLQLVLQQPINSMPVSLLLVQITASMVYFAYSGLQTKEWVEVRYNVILLWLIAA